MMRWPVAPATAVLLAEEGQGALVVGVVSQHFGDSFTQNGGSVGVQHPDGAPDHAAKVATGQDPALEVLLDVRDLGAEAVALLEIMSGPLLPHERGTVVEELTALNLAFARCRDIARRRGSENYRTSRPLSGSLAF